nr:gliding motility-associated C-terminal domain-containing protein [uncultured Arsenicibacter sp.]
MTRTFSSPATATDYSLVLYVWTNEAEFSKLPNSISVDLYRQRDKVKLTTFTLPKLAIPQANPKVSTICFGDTTIPLIEAAYQTLTPLTLNPTTYNDPDGYFFVNSPSTPLGTRPKTTNHSSPNPFFYHWFSPSFLGTVPDNRIPGLTPTIMKNELTAIRCVGNDTGFQRIAQPSSGVSAASDPVLSVIITLEKPLGGINNGILQEVNWNAGYSSTSPYPGSPWTVTSGGPTKNGVATASATPSSIVQRGVYSFASIYEQRINGQLVSKSLTETTYIYTVCPTIRQPEPLFSTLNTPATVLKTPPAICPGQSLITKISTYQRYPQTYTWTLNGAPFATTSDSTYILNQPGNYKVMVSGTGICDKKETSFTIDLAPPPSVSITSNAASLTGCVSTGVVTLDAVNSTSGVSYKWLLGTNVFVSPAGNSITTKTSGIYSVIVTSPEGCTARSNEISLNFTGPPSVSIAQPASTTFCPGATADLQTDLITGYQYEWFRNGVTTGVTTFSIKSIDTGAFTVKITGFGGCTAISAPITMSSPVLIKPTISGDPILCLGKSLTLTASPNGLSAYQWFRDATIEPGGTSQVLSTSLAGQYTVRVTFPNGCTILSEKHQLLQTSTVPISISPIGPICGPSSIPLSLSATPGGGTFSGQGVIGNLFIPQAAGIGSTTVTYMPPASLSGCTTGNPTMVVVVRPIPPLNLPPILETGPDTPTLLPGDLGPGYQYQWTPSLYLNNPAIGNAISTPSVPVTYSLTVTDSLGCMASDTVRLELIQGFYAPTAFTPNNDRINDVWILTGISDYPDIQVSIFNRWGELVFHSKGYAQPFDGNYAGEPLPMGIYSYLIRFKPTEQPRRGTLTLLR